ncbi:hypothetical protein Q9233_000550 [Columba guinea]|nr:hypothetical protein Q9233_000550 [Columba guinea]
MEVDNVLFSGIGKECNGSNSGAESTKKLVAVDSPLSDEYASQKAADLEKEAADDSTLSFHEKKLPQTMLLESENIQDDRKDGEEECLESQNEDDNRKNNQECSAPEEAPCGNGESEHCNDLPIRELQKKRNQERNKPRRKRKTRNASASGIGKECNGSNSGAESTKKLVAVDSPLSDEYASQKAADLEKEAADDSTLSFHEKKLPQTMLLESENIQDDRKDGEEECLESQNEDDNRKNNQECSAPEEAPCGNGESEHCNDLPIRELQKKRNQERNKPRRKRKTRNASASGIGKECNGSNSGAESTKKLVAVDSPLSDEYASQKAADLEKEAADDSTLSFHEKKLPQTMLLESENIQDDRKDGEEECLESQNEDDNRKNNQECSAPEEAPCGNGESEHCNDLPIRELQKKRNQERNKPRRKRKTRNASASGEKKAFECCCSYLLSHLTIF